MPWRGRWPRWAALAAVTLGVLALHGSVAEWTARHAASIEDDDPMPARIQVAYVREMALEAPPVRPVPLRIARHALPPQKDAAPVPAPEASASQPDVVEGAAELAASAVAAIDEPASVPVLAAASDAKPFEWPGSTRLRYQLTGNYRGEVTGEAQVEWIRVGMQYQLHLDVTVGMTVAPLLTRRMSSHGAITPEGLAPQRYDQDTKLLLHDRQRATMFFEPDIVVLANGQRQPRGSDVQDTASQFVQLTWLFSTQPERLRSGEVVEVPLALPRHLSTWTYDVLGEETLYTPFGELPAFHLKPRHEARAGGDLVTEIWFAPQLRYLPVRFRIHQDAETYVDLMLDRRPELAGP